jgi:hypothetical protein
MKLQNTINVPNQFAAQGINHIAIYQNGVVSTYQKNKPYSKLSDVIQTYDVADVRSIRISPSGEYIGVQTSTKTVRLRNGVQETFDNNIGQFSIADTGQIVMIALASGAVQVIDSSVTNLTVAVTDDDRVVCAAGRYMVYNRARTITALYTDLVLTPVASAKEIVYATHDHNGKFVVFYSDNTFSYDGAAAKTFVGPAQGFRDLGDQILCTDMKKDWVVNHFRPLAYPEIVRNFSWKPPVVPNVDFSSMLLMVPGTGITTADFDVKKGLAVANSGGLGAVADSPYGAAGASLNFDGTTSFLQTADSADIQLGANDFTIELFVKVIAANTGSIVFHKGADGTLVPSYVLTATANKTFNFNISTNGTAYAFTLTDVGKFELGVWTHVAITRKGNKYRFFQDGKMRGSFMFAGALFAHTGKGLQFGHYRTGNYNTGPLTSLFNGRIHNMRILNYAKYTHDFYPETLSVTAS